NPNLHAFLKRAVTRAGEVLSNVPEAILFCRAKVSLGLPDSDNAVNPFSVTTRGWENDSVQVRAARLGESAHGCGRAGSRPSGQGQAGRIREDLQPLWRGFLLYSRHRHLLADWRLRPLRFLLQRGGRRDAQL